jgi:hypothetical protein
MKTKTIEELRTEEFFNNWATKNVEVKGGNPKTYELRPEQIFKCMQEYADQSQEPKQREEFEEITIFEDSTYTIQFRDNLTSRGTSDFKIKGSELLKLMLPIDIGEQSEVSMKQTNK